MWVVSLCLSFFLFDQKLSKPIRGFLLVLALLWIYWGFIRNLSWVAGWLPIFVSGFFIIFNALETPSTACLFGSCCVHIH